MKHLDFILWMVLFPVSISIVNYIDGLSNKTEYSKDAKGFSAMVIIFIWLFIGYHLF